MHRVLTSVFICCLWVCTVPASARAAASISSVVCTDQNVMVGKMGQWQIKGTAQVTGLNPQNAQTMATFQFQVSNDGGKTFSDMNLKVTGTTTAVNGTANFDTGWQNFAPAKGQQFRVVVSASYIDGTGKEVAIGVVNSDPNTPIP